MSYEYKVQGQTVRLDIDPTMVAVKFGDATSNSERAAAVAAAGAGAFVHRFEVPGEELTLVPIGNFQNAAISASNATIAALNSQPDVSAALPVFKVGGNSVVASDRIVVGFNDVGHKDTLATAHGLSVIEGWGDTVVYRIPAGSSAFDILPQIEADASVQYAEPDFVTIGKHLPKRPALSVLPLTAATVVGQYAMRQTRVDDAHQQALGRPEIRIAILDEGTDTGHPDLAPATVATFDATDNDSYQEPNPWDGHGTACAGLALAMPSSPAGVYGAGRGCSLLAVRIARSTYPGGTWQTTDSAIAKAIWWARTNGAAVISNSWGGGAPSNAIIKEVEDARKLGRGGLGCVVVFAAGNEAGPVTFPATLPNVLTVAASNHVDQAKTRTSSDGEDWWGTNFGPEVDVAAPGVFNLTTDIVGSGGYDISGNYTSRFNGTSSSTPIVAGICGLLLSVRPALTELQVRDAIKASAARVGDVPYVNGRNAFFGNGRVDALAALQRVLAM